MLITSKRVYEHQNGYMCQETLAAGVARGRHEEHQHACIVMRRIINDIASTRFPLIAPFLKERVNKIESFSVLHQCIFVLSTAWVAEDVLRFLLALDDGLGES